MILIRLKSYNLERFSQDKTWVEDKQSWRRIKAVWRSFWKEWRVLEETLEKNVFKLLFSSSAAVYDDKQPLPLKETGKNGIASQGFATLRTARAQE